MVNKGVEYGIMIKGAEAERGSGLSPCKCGNEAIYIKYDGGWFVKCTCCETMQAKQISVITQTIIPFDSKEEAKKAWNKRSIPTLEGFNAKENPELVIKRRNYRAGLIANSIKNAGKPITAAEIAADTGLSVNVIRNHMYYVKDKYPMIKLEKGNKGYYWESKENE